MPSLLAAALRWMVNGCRVVEAGELLGAGEFQLHRAPQFQRGERHDVLGEDFLLAAEAAAHPSRDHPDPVLGEVEDPAQGAPDQEGHLAGGADLEPAVVVDQGDGGVGLQGGVLHPLGAVGLLVDEIRGGEGRGDVAQFGVQLGHDVLFRPADAGRRGVLVAVDQRRAGAHGVLRGEHGIQHLVLHFERPDAGFRRGHAVRDDGGDPLPDEPDHVVEHPGVVRVVGVELVLGRGNSCAGASSWVKTASTPGIRSASAESMDSTRACACGERRSFTCRSPGSWSAGTSRV